MDVVGVQKDIYRFFQFPGRKLFWLPTPPFCNNGFFNQCFSITLWKPEPKKEKEKKKTT
jgi:hypothetical protein